MRWGPGTFRALASPRRTAILAALRRRPHTGSELARVLGLSDTAVRKHLRVLTEAGLVERRDEGRPWTYHELTPDARALLDSPPSGAPLGVVAVLAAALSVVLSWQWSVRRPEPLPPTQLGFQAPPDPLLPWLLGGAVAAGVLFLSCLGALAWWRRVRRRLRAPG